MQSWVRGHFQPLTTFGRLNRSGGTGKNQDVVNGAKLQEIVRNQGAFEKRLFLRAKHTGSWLSIWGTTGTGTVLAAT